MEVGDKVPIVDDSSPNGTKVCTLSKCIYTCKYFKIFLLSGLGGHYKDEIHLPKNREEKTEYELFRSDFNNQLLQESKLQQGEINE